MEIFHSRPSQLKSFYTHSINTLTQLLESQVRMQQFDQGVIQLAIKEAGLLSSQLKTLSDHDATAFAKRCEIIKTNLTLLNNLKNKEAGGNFKHIESLLIDTHELIERLALTLIDKRLFERQSGVLENIILSHENVAQWKEFVQDILREFHGFFPFNFFTIAFADDNGISVYIYYLGQYSDETKRFARKKLTTDLIKQLKVNSDCLVDLEEFTVSGIQQQREFESLEILTVGVPGDKVGVGGILGVGYASGYPLSIQEQSIIRSLLSVMVMVVGSSKSLNKSLLELEYYAEHDPLTGLHNRRYFNEILQYEIDRASRHNHQFSVLSIDLDNFKKVNDGYGHLCGDQVLVYVAQILRKQLRKGDILTRVGGDEFSIILPETDAAYAGIVANSLRQAVQDYEFVFAQRQESVHISISVGFAAYPVDAQTTSDLLNNADIALYHAKDSGRNFVCSASELGHNVANNKKMIGLSEVLRKALKEQRIIPYFQPIMDCKNGEIFAYEALARLQTEEGDIISAGLFIEAADKYGISLNLDHVMLKKVTEFMARHKSLNGSMPRVFINLTPQEIQRRDILQYAEKLCKEYNIPADRLVFEVTEREAISDLSSMRKFLTNLREKGFAFALDDFGSGYNSFHYLRELHFEYVKIDGAFITNILESKIDSVLIENLNNICQQLGMKTLAEFVESEAIMKRLQKMGIDYAQGFHLGLPEKNFI